MLFSKRFFVSILLPIILAGCTSVSRQNSDFLTCDGHKSPDVGELTDAKTAKFKGYPAQRHLNRKLLYNNPYFNINACDAALKEPMIEQLPGREISLRLSRALHLLIEQDQQEAAVEVNRIRALVNEAQSEVFDPNIIHAIDLLEILSTPPSYASDFVSTDPILEWAMQRPYSATLQSLAAEIVYSSKAMRRKKGRAFLDGWAKLSPEARSRRAYVEELDRNFLKAAQDYYYLVDFGYNRDLLGTELFRNHPDFRDNFLGDYGKRADVPLILDAALYAAFLGDLPRATKLIEQVERQLGDEYFDVNKLQHGKSGADLFLGKVQESVKESIRDFRLSVLNGINRKTHNKLKIAKAMLYLRKNEKMKALDAVNALDVHRIEFQDKHLDQLNVGFGLIQNEIIQELQSAFNAASPLKFYKPVDAKAYEYRTDISLEAAMTGMKRPLYKSGLFYVREIETESLFDDAKFSLRDIDTNHVNIEVIGRYLPRIPIEEAIMLHGAHLAIRRGYAGLIVVKRLDQNQDQSSAMVKTAPSWDSDVNKIEMRFKFVVDATRPDAFDAQKIVETLSHYPLSDSILQN